MADLPLCRNFLEGSCERSDQILLAETDAAWTFGCGTCRSVWVVTKPRERAKARYFRTHSEAAVTNKQIMLLPGRNWKWRKR